MGGHPLLRIESIAFVLLRESQTDVLQPYRVPLRTVGCVAMLGPPHDTHRGDVMAIVLVLQPTLRFVEKRRLLLLCRQFRPRGHWHGPFTRLGGGAASAIAKPRWCLSGCITCGIHRGPGSYVVDV
jgi:hypothetical protein